MRRMEMVEEADHGWSDDDLSLASDDSELSLSYSSSEDESSFTQELAAAGAQQHLPREQQPEGCDSQLYSLAKLTVYDSFLILLQFFLRFQLSRVALETLLKLICAHLPDPNLCFTSFYRLRKFCLHTFPDFKSIRHRYCMVCKGPLVDESAERCPMCESSKSGRFLIADICVQLKEKFRDPHFWKAVKSRPDSNCTTLSDIYDGLEYRNHSQRGGFLCKSTNPANVSLLLNTDGISLFKSSSTDIWPVYLTVNELPSHMRFSKKYMILAGLWYGKEKPFMLTYLQPVVDQINHLYTEGITITTADELVMVSRAMVLLCSLDLPARAIVTNMKHFNGKYGCCICEDTGDNSLGNNPLLRVWPYCANSTIRSKESVYTAIRKAVDEGEDMGYKGFPVLAQHPPFHPVKGVVIDYLHCVLLGVSKTLMRFWLDSKKRTKEFYIGNQTQLINERLCNINVPDNIKRPPRELKERKHWKGTEWQYWLLFYSLPVLLGILPPVYYVHYCAYVCAIALLLKDNITEADLRRADVLLAEFCIHSAILYGYEIQTMNMHMLRHLVYCVKNWGPLWSYSCFGFESVNGQLKKLFHGTRDMSEQMVFSFTVLQSLPHMTRFMSPQGQVLRAKLFGDEVRHGRRTQQYQDGSWRIGKSQWSDVDVAVGILIEQVCGVKPNKAVKFWRFEKSAETYCSKEYSRTVFRNSYTIMFESFKFGFIKYFLEVPCQNTLTGTSHPYVFAIVSLFSTQQFGHCPHLFFAQESGLLQPILMSSVSISKCVFVRVGLQSFVAAFPCRVLPAIT